MVGWPKRGYCGGHRAAHAAYSLQSERAHCGARCPLAGPLFGIAGCAKESQGYVRDSGIRCGMRSLRWIAAGRARRDGLRAALGPQ